MKFTRPQPPAYKPERKEGFIYSRDKRGWVTFTNGKKKMKLRAYVLMLAERLTHWNDDRLNTNRDLLIKYYNKDGLAGVKRTYEIMLGEAVAKKGKE